MANTESSSEKPEKKKVGFLCSKFNFCSINEDRIIGKSGSEKPNPYTRGLATFGSFSSY